MYYNTDNVSLQLPLAPLLRVMEEIKEQKNLKHCTSEISFFLYPYRDWQASISAVCRDVFRGWGAQEGFMRYLMCVYHCV